MAEAVVSATIQVLLENLLTLPKEQMGLVLNFKDDLEKLQETISMVNDFLHDAEKRPVTDKAVKRWLRNLEALAFEADNVFDEANYRLLSKKVGATINKTLKKKVQSFFSSSYRRKLSRRIKGINEKFESINRQATGLGLQKGTATQAPDYASTSRQTDSFSKDPIFLGREDEVLSIVGTLITTERELSVLPIVGMGGLGKTTLARKVFNHEQIKSHFGDKQRVWVHVPTIFDDSVLLERILTSMKPGSHVQHGNREALLKMLQEQLGANKYLLVLDDVWNEDKEKLDGFEKWDDFKRSFSGISSATGNCMVVTTRSESVASTVGTLPVHKLKGLSIDDCWSIIKAKAFSVGDNTLEFEATGKNVAEKCRGLPLAANVVGGLLVGKSKDEWMSIEKKWLSNLGDENPITKILKLSFDNLSLPSLKKCFAYCSIFPKGYQIEKERLVELWMAEGFLQTLDGDRVFNLLLHSSLLQVARSDDYGNVTHCNMHDHVHDLASSVLCENDNTTNGVCHRRYIGYISGGDRLLSIPEGKERRYVRTLFLKGKVFDIRFLDFESLRTLTLMSTEDVDELPTSITKLKHLKYLDISETRIKYLPDSIGELYHLQTLRATQRNYYLEKLPDSFSELYHLQALRATQRNYYLEKLPDSFSYLISLRHLHIHATTSLPPKIGKLTSLQTLAHFHVRGEKGYGIQELGNLKNLKGELDISNLENVCDKNEAMRANLSQKSSIYKLRLVWDVSRDGDEANDRNVFEGLQPHPNLKRLEICGFKGENLSLLEGLSNLMEIKLEKCSECEELPMFGRLPNLESLCLDDLINVKSIRSFYGDIDNCRSDTTIVVFRALEKLELLNMANLEEWDEVSLTLPSQIFPRLKYMKIYGCKRLTRAPSDFPCLEELEIYGMESSLALENICGIKLTSLARLNIEEIEGLECLPHWLFSNNHNLTKLEIWSCPKMTHLVPCLGGGGAPCLLRELRISKCRSLRELPDDLHSLSSLEELRIIDCPDLKSIPYQISSGGGQQQQQQQQGFTSLCKLRIWDCEELTNLPIEMVESCTKSLESLWLRGLSNITNFPMVTGSLHRMTSLIELVIKDVPKFSSNDIIGTNRLQHLEIGPSSWNNNVSYNESVGAMLLHSIGSLRRLALHGKEHWDSLPDELQHLTSLERLWLQDFGIEALPEWFENLSSLMDLTLYNCKRLRHLPSKQAMLRLSKLTFLHIYHCPLLLKENRSNNNNNNVNKRRQIDDTEWPKISHIPSVSVL